MLVDINLLPQKERDRPVMLFAALGIVLAAILIWLIFFFMAQSQAAEQAALDAEYAQVSAEGAALRAQLEAAVGMNEEQQLKATVDWAESYQFDTIPLLADLVSRLPERGFFDSFSFTKPNEAILSVQFDTAREAAYYLAQLKTSELITSAKLDSVINEELEAAEEADVLEDTEEKIIENPRYLATYSLVYVDERTPSEEAVEAADGTVAETPAAEEAPASDEPAEAAPAETEENAQ
ncbi:PilN domain-containing protein [Planomicrobium sp. CPCC 101079]|uniref:PilN domain-containing protein n=1 Tax=Planomicrobium sp. CPCC 101079 TaxID=2599618 RepID=UPI0011B6DB8B|nr:fimbrial assembly protein [Planomicrobium sp. CPCC 101079]TWT09017.1 fimbrial assembly protein [Planomicrobium sp. CPCC 101079]